MNNPIDLDAFLSTDSRDVGCEGAMALLHVYTELYANDPDAARTTYAGIAAHLAACEPCFEDFQGLLALTRM